jgi:hypothetical protein
LCINARRERFCRVLARYVGFYAFAFNALALPCIPARDRHTKYVVAGQIKIRTAEYFSRRSGANYFQRNAARMRYPKFRQQGLFVGSGVIEAGCKTLIATRLKRSGMFWTVRGANAVIAVRCCRHSREFDDYWESRRP